MAKFGRIAAIDMSDAARSMKRLSVGLYHLDDDNISESSISLSKLNVDIATQAELDAVDTDLSTLDTSFSALDLSFDILSASTLSHFATYDSLSASSLSHFNTYDSLSASTAAHFITYDSLSASTLSHFSTYDSLSASTLSHFVTYDSLSASTLSHFNTYNALSASTLAHVNNTSNPHAVTAAQVGNGTAIWNANKIYGESVTITSGALNDILLRGASAWVNTSLFMASNWVPTYGATESMTFTSPSLEVAQYVYLPWARVCWLWLRASGTTGGTASYGITGSLPYTSDTTAYTEIEGYVVDGAGADQPGLLSIPPNSNSATILKLAAGFPNWGLGASRYVSFNGWYRTKT
jgi:hypothetical protein